MTNEINESNEQQIIQFFTDPHFRINKILMKNIGVTNAIWISSMLSKYKYFRDKNMLDDEGYFYNLQSEIEKDIGFSRSTQNRIIKFLIDIKILDVKRKDIPAKNYYKINISELSRYSKREHLDAPIKGNINNNNKKLEKSSFTNLRKLVKERDLESLPLLDLPKEISNNTIKRKRPTKVREPIIRPRKGHLSINQASKDTIDILQYWNNKSENPTHKPRSDLVEKTLYLLETKLLLKYGYDKICSAIDTMIEIRNSKNFYIRFPRDKLSIYEFFTGNGFIKNGKDKIIWFNVIVTNDYVVYRKSRDIYPEITLELKKLYHKHVTCQDTTFTEKQENQFLQASRKANEAVEKGRLNKYIVNADYKTYCLHLFMALTAKYGEDSSNIEVGHLCSGTTWNNIWPRYITRRFIQ